MGSETGRPASRNHGANQCPSIDSLALAAGVAGIFVVNDAYEV